ncbi:MAG: histidine kinase dimerization/phosphoacceptor domain -containing protein [Bacteroidota bacterium]
MTIARLKNYVVGLTLIFTLVLHDAASQQVNKIDSLKTALGQTLSDSLRFKVTFRLANELVKKNRDSANAYFKKSIQIAERSQNRLNEASAYFEMSNNLGMLYRFEEAVSSARSALELGNDLLDTLGRMRYNLRLAHWLYYDRRYHEAIDHYRVAMPLAEQIDKVDTYVKLCTYMARAKTKVWESDSAMHYLVKALKYEDHDAVKPGTITTMYRQFSLLYTSMKQYEQALPYALKAIARLEKQKNAYGSVITELIRVSLIYKPLGNVDEALVVLKKAEKLAKEHDYHYLDWSLYSSLGYTYIKLDRFEEALESFREKDKSAQSSGDSYRIAAAKCSLAEVYNMLGEYDSARHLAEQAKALMAEFQEDNKKSGRFDLLLSTSLTFYTIDTIFHDYASALKHYKLHVSYLDSLNSMEKQNEVDRMKIGYETAKKEQEIQLLAARNKVQMAQQRIERDLMIASIVGAILLTLLLIMIYKRYSLKAHAYNTIKNQKTDIEARNATNEKLIDQIHHRVKNNLQIMLSMLNTQGYLLKNDEKAKAIVQESQNRIKSLALIHNNLHHSGRYLIVNAKRYLEELTTNVTASFSTKAKRIQLQTAIEDAEISMDFAVPLGLIINELISSTFQYASGDGKEASTLSLEFTQVADQVYELTLSDDGLGFPPDFDLSGSNNFGMQLVEGLTQQLAGRMTISSDCGTCFNFTLKDQMVKERNSQRHLSLNTL